VDEVVNDILQTFHHPTIRNERADIHRDMFNTVRKWADEYPRRHELNQLLGSESVKAGKNHILSGHKSKGQGHSHGSGLFDQLGHGQPSGSLWSQVKMRDMESMGVGDSEGRLRPDYASSRPQSSGSPGRPPPSPKFGYGQSGPPMGGEAAGYYGGASSSGDAPYSQSHSRHSSSGYQPYQQPPYGAPPPSGAHYGAPPPGPYPGSEYGGQPPPHYQGGAGSYGNQQYPPYPY
jgi:hypothetical protein